MGLQAGGQPRSRVMGVASAAAAREDTAVLRDGGQSGKGGPCPQRGTGRRADAGSRGACLAEAGAAGGVGGLRVGIGARRRRLLKDRKRSSAAPPGSCPFGPLASVRAAAGRSTGLHHPGGPGRAARPRQASESSSATPRQGPSLPV